MSSRDSDFSELFVWLIVLLLSLFRWMGVSLVIAKVAFSYKREYKTELEEAMEKYIAELSKMEEDETW